MIHIWILPLLIQISFQLKAGSSTLSSLKSQDWIKCRSHSDCLNGGSCELNDDNELACICQVGWKGSDCGEITCETEGSCKHGSCMHGKHCVCDPGWRGYFCDNVLTSLECNDFMECRNGDCVNGTCICLPGFHGTKCDVFNCSQGECGSHGKCIDNICECDHNWSGAVCDQVINDWMKCANDSSCLHGGVCELHDNQEFRCRCQPGWTGGDCSEVTCETKGSCVRGTCMYGKNCVCDAGWHGIFCNESLTCGHQMKCENGDCVNGTCICQPGFHGATCIVFNCVQGGCGVHGKCSRNTTCCECDSGFHGTTCNVFNCSQGGCGFNGRCSDDASNCECDKGWSGSFCELEDWITFQRRMVFDIDFKKSFSEYERGFGDVKGAGDFWLGLEKIHNYTKTGTWELRIEVVAFNGSRFYSEYSGFKVLEQPLYKITWSSKSRGNINDMPGYGMNYHKNAPFSAWDRDQDKSWSRDCSNEFGKGGWWFDHCHRVYLNTDRATSSTVDLSRMRWYTGSGEDIPLIGSTMKMRRVE